MSSVQFWSRVGLSLSSNNIPTPTPSVSLVLASSFPSRPEDSDLDTDLPDPKTSSSTVTEGATRLGSCLVLYSFSCRGRLTSHQMTALQLFVDVCSSSSPKGRTTSEIRIDALSTSATSMIACYRRAPSTVASHSYARSRGHRPLRYKTSRRKFDMLQKSYQSARPDPFTMLGCCYCDNNCLLTPKIRYPSLHFHNYLSSRGSGHFQA